MHRRPRCDALRRPSQEHVALGESRGHLDALRLRYRVPLQTIIDRLGVVRVRVEGPFYEPADDGTEMLLISSFEAPPRLPDGRWRAPNDIIDLIVFRPIEPARWWSRCAFIAALGEAGVTKALAILEADMMATLAHLGRASVAELDRSAIDLG